LRKIITIFLMIVILSTPGRFAWAEDGGDGGADDGSGGVSAISRPIGFITIAVLQTFIIATLFTSRMNIGAPNRNLIANLALSGTLTTIYFLFVMETYARYILFLYSLPFNYLVSTNSVNSTVPDASDPEWSAADPEFSNNTVASLKSEEDEAISKAVKRALRDPELAKQYIQFASPKLRDAVKKALANQVSDSAKGYQLGSEKGNFSALAN
jgi:hypothetical protein